MKILKCKLHSKGKVLKKNILPCVMGKEKNDKPCDTSYKIFFSYNISWKGKDHWYDKKKEIFFLYYEKIK